MNDRANTYDRVTVEIVAALEAGVRPWMQPWKAERVGAGLAFPRRSNGERYRGINVLLLWCAAASAGFTHDQWMTYKQAQELGGQVRKGEKGSLVVKYGTFTPKDGTDAAPTTGDDEERSIPFLRGYTVFNVSQIDGLPAEFYAEPVPLPVDHRIERAETFVAATGARITYDSLKACFIPALDKIEMPPFAAFDSPDAFYATLFHELAHWVGGPKRLDRIESTSMKTKAYAFEELIAEISACFLCADLGIAATIRPESASYLAGWLKALKDDNRAILRAASKAQAAVDFLHGLQTAGEDSEREAA